MRRCLRVIGVLLTGALAAGCGDEADGAGDTGDGDACPGATSPLTDEEMARSGASGQTEFTVRFESLACVGAPQALVFRVGMTNHTCNIPGYELDLDQHARVLTSDGGVQADGLGWEVLSADDHHPLGLLTVPATHGDGQPLVGCDATSLTLELTGIDMAAGEAALFSWDGVLLDAVRDCP